MKIKDFEPVSGQSARLGSGHHRPRQSASSPGIGAALLGAICVIGVFAALALLYSVH